MELEEFKQRVAQAEVGRTLAHQNHLKKQERIAQLQDLGATVGSFTEKTQPTRKKSECCGTNEAFYEDDEDLESLLLTAHSLLEEAMQHLGFYGDPNLTPKGKISKSDQRYMLGTAAEIKEFLDQLGDISDMKNINSAAPKTV